VAPFIHGRRSALQALCEVPFPLSYWGLSGNTTLSDFSISSSFRIRKSIGRGYSSQSPQVFGLPSPPHSSSTTLLVFVPWLGYRCTLSPLSPPLSWHLTAPLSLVDLMEVVARFVRNVLNRGDVGVVLSCVVYRGC